MKRLKRWISGVLVICLCLSLAPSVFAEEDRAMGTAGMECAPIVSGIMPMERSDPPTAFGIDISSHQGVVDWEKVAPQIDFAIIRCGYGSDYEAQDDAYWHQNVQACMELGIPFGVYIYSYATTVEKARSEARHVLRLVSGYSPDLPIYYDLEDQRIIDSCSPDQILEITRTFCQTIEAAGYQVGVYANRHWWNNYLTSPEYDRWDRWYAQYASTAAYDGDYTIWQYTETGRMEGVTGNVDLNYWYGDFPAHHPEPAGSYEHAWFPGPVMNVTRLAYEAEDHARENAIDISPEGPVFAPFTGQIVYRDAVCGYVVLQSVEKVMWADGTCDYMTVGFTHDENIEDLPVGKILCQGEDFYHAAQVHITVHRGRVIQSDPYGTADTYAFDAFYVNRAKTPVTVGRGEGCADPEAQVNHDAPRDYRGRWQYLNDDSAPPTAATLFLEKTEFLTGEEFTFTLSADTDCEFYLSILDADSGQQIVGEATGSTYTGAFEDPGHYIARMSACDTSGRSVDSDPIDFWVYGTPPSAAALAADRTTLVPGDSVTLTTSTDAPYARIRMRILMYRNQHDGREIFSGEVPCRYVFQPEEEGLYTAHVTAWTPDGMAHAAAVILHVGQFTVQYDANGGDGAPAAQTKYYEADLTLSTAEPTKENHVFLGWASALTSDTAEYKPGETFQANADTTLYAVWADACAAGHAYADSVCLRCGQKKPMDNPFTDVSGDSFHYEPVLWALENGITNGTSDTVFGSEDPCMRAQVVTFLWRAAGSPEPESRHNPFVDVKETDFYHKAVLWAVEKGITNGLDDTHFGPLTHCNRAQVVTFLWRAKGQPEFTGSDMPFTDVSSGAWYEAPIRWAVENGITNGMSATGFGISLICNRAQIVTFLYRTYH